MSSMSLLKLNLTKQNRRFLTKCTRQFWTTYANLLKRNVNIFLEFSSLFWNMFEISFLYNQKLHNLNSRLGSSNEAHFVFNNETKTFEISNHKNGNSSHLSSPFVWSDGNIPKGFEKYFPGGKKASSSNESSSENKNPFDFTKKSDSDRGASGGPGGASSSNSDDKWAIQFAFSLLPN